MKRTLALVGLAFLILAPPAHAQQDGEWQVRNEAVSFTGTGENGTCEPQTIDPFTFDLRFGPGTEVRTLQDGQITAVGNFDPQTGAVTVARGGVSKELTPDGQGGWTGSYNSNGCSWTLNGETNEAGLVFVEQDSPAGAVGADAGISPVMVAFVVLLAILLLLLLLYLMFQLTSDEEKKEAGFWSGLWQWVKGKLRIGGRSSKGRAGSTVDMATVEESVDTVAEAVKDMPDKVDGNFLATDDLTVNICGETTEPVELEPGKDVSVWVWQGPGVNPPCASAASSGTVTATFSRTS